MFATLNAGTGASVSSAPLASTSTSSRFQPMRVGRPPFPPALIAQRNCNDELPATFAGNAYCTSCHELSAMLAPPEDQTSVQFTPLVDAWINAESMSRNPSQRRKRSVSDELPAALMTGVVAYFTV